jgi:hypothetical protein
MNTLLPARMFVFCSVVCFGNGFVGSSYYYEILKQVQNDDLKAQRQKVSAFFKLLLCGIGSCILVCFKLNFSVKIRLLDFVCNEVY